MAAAVFGGSPRHHSSSHSGHRSSNSNNFTTIAGRLAHSSPSLQHPNPIHPSVHMNPASNTIFPPPTSFISAATPVVASIVTSANMHSQYHQSQPQHYQQHLAGGMHHHPHQQPPQHHLSHQQQQQHHFRHSKRKTAVEMLAESKPFYVKSDVVLDRQQQFSYGGRAVVANSAQQQSPSCLMSPSRTPVAQHRHTISGPVASNSFANQTTGSINRRTGCGGIASSSSDLLQTKLRSLLNTSIDHGQSDSLYHEGPTVHYASKTKPDSPSSAYDQHSQYMSPKKLSHQELSVLPDQNSDISVFFPSAFLSPQSLPPHPTVNDDDIFSYGIDDSLLLTEDDYQTISPPAEYAEDTSTPMKSNMGRIPSSRYQGYQRSYSHSPAVAPMLHSPHHDDTTDDPNTASASGTTSTTSYNINSHKSLPDLHSQISRHSPHSEALSCCSRGNRSNKSGSSFNRDSGGSSGHYTHRSEPNGGIAVCSVKPQPNQKDQLGTPDFRRDSGSSTQHSGNSYYAYGIPPLRYDCMECRAKIQKDANCLLNFTTPEVPEAFQDDYAGREMSMREHQPQQQDDSRLYEKQRRESNAHYRSNKVHEHGTASGHHSPEGELSPPLGTFKRQRCLRVKQRSSGRNYSPCDRNCRSEEDRKPILRSKSDISDKYWQRGSGGGHQALHQPQPLQHHQMLSDKPQQSQRRTSNAGKYENTTQLERFFDRLGLNEDAYEECIVPKSDQLSSESESDHSSPVFFSDASTVDSTRLPDSTEVTPQQQMYRPSEPPSIVERNARIIKWLCNCRKLQIT